MLVHHDLRIWLRPVVALARGQSNCVLVATRPAKVPSSETMIRSSRIGSHPVE